MERRLAAILAADVAGYSRLMGADEAGTLAALKAHRKELVEVKIAAHQGRIVKLTGDGLLVEFMSVVNALACAADIQRRMRERNLDVPAERRIEFRIGVNLGDIIVEDSDIFGDGVNVAARLESLASPGGISVSASVREHIGNRLDIAFEDAGEQRLKNIERPVRVFHVALAPMTQAPPTRQDHSDRAKPAIAVLPFTNMSGDPEQDYFSDGITEDIITELSRFRSLVVISPPSSFAFKGRLGNVQTVGRELDVHYVVQGSVRKAEGRVRVTVQLVDASSGNHLWAERYDRNLADIFSVQDEMTQSIVVTLAGRLDDVGRERAFRKGSENLSQCDLLMRGRHFLNRGSRDDILQARDFFKRAVDQDSSDAQAHVGLAHTYAEESRSDWSDAPDAAAKRAFDLACAAVELDDRDSQAHLILAWGYFRTRSNFDLAASQVEQAITLNPNDWSNYCFKSWLLTCSGDSDGGIACAKEAIRRNPLAPNDCLWTIGYADYLAGRYEQALSAFGRMGFPRHPDVSAFMAACYAQLDRPGDARAEAEQFRRLVASELGDRPTQSAESWRSYWCRRAPFKDAAQLNHLLEDLRKAGLPE